MLGFPCDQFGLKEPAENVTELLHGIRFVRPGNDFVPHPSFHLFWKIIVNGEGTHPMYTFLKNACPQTQPAFRDKKMLYWDAVSPNDIAWNFEKFLIDQNGVPRYRFADSAWENGDFVKPFMIEMLTLRNNGTVPVPAAGVSISTSLVMTVVATVATVLFSRVW